MNTPPALRVELEPASLSLGEAQALTVRLTNQSPGTLTGVVFRMALPPEVLLLAGAERLARTRLVPGDSASLALRVRPRAAGCFTIRCPEFVYRDTGGRIRRFDAFDLNIEVNQTTPRPPPEAPRLRVTVATAELPLAEWTALIVHLIHSGGAAVRDFRLSAGSDANSPVRSQGPTLGRDIGSERTCDVTLAVYAREPGAQVPVDLVLDYADEHGCAGKLCARAYVTVRGAAPPRPPKGIRVLFLGAQPNGSQHLRLGQEDTVIRRGLKIEIQAGLIVLDAHHGVSVGDISGYLIEFQPDVLHFSGHGAATGQLLFEAFEGTAQVVDAVSLSALLRYFADRLQCIVLNACFTAKHASLFSRHVQWVIAMRGEVEDDAALIFSASFYKALANGRSIEHAFGIGCADAGLAQPEWADKPLLLRRTDTSTME